MRIMIPLAILAFGTADVANAQARNGAYVGGGFEAAGIGAPYERAYGLSLQAGYLRQLRRVTLRIGATYFERNRELSTFAARPRAVGLNAELSYDLTSTRLRPYVLGGWGLYRLWSNTYSSSGLRVVDQISPAMIGGLGAHYRVGKVDLFGEARLHGFTNGQNWGSVLMPVTVGVRFD
jgi:hypothetical protein